MAWPVTLSWSPWRCSHPTMQQEGKAAAKFSSEMVRLSVCHHNVAKHMTCLHLIHLFIIRLIGLTMYLKVLWKF